MKKALTNLTPDELNALFERWDEGPARARRVLGHLYREGCQSVAQMSGVRVSLRERLDREFVIPALTLREKQAAADGTTKFLFGLSDGETIETVVIPDVGIKKGKRALCVSTQVGCAMGCTFCRTGMMGLKRNLLAWEIVEQFRETQRQIGVPITHLVFMGMGEPLHNYPALRRAIAILSAPGGANLAETKMTVSTAGLLPPMKKLAHDSQVLLALSLHAPDDALREAIMPVNRTYSIDALLRFVRALPPKKQARFCFEYILLENLNDRPEQARHLADKLAGLPCKINLIPFNDVPGTNYRRPSDERIFAFQRTLKTAGFNVSIRVARGREIAAACGQLSSTRRVNASPGGPPGHNLG